MNNMRIPDKEELSKFYSLGYSMKERHNLKRKGNDDLLIK